jgi:hypothetical protein
VRPRCSQAADADDASAALDGNTRRVTALVAEVLPAERERTFTELWEGHADAVVEHARAAAPDSQDRSAAAARLTDTTRALGEFLGQDVAGAPLRQHAASLREQADAWSADPSGDAAAVQAYTSVIADHAAMAELGARAAMALDSAGSGS